MTEDLETLAWRMAQKLKRMATVVDTMRRLGTLPVRPTSARPMLPVRMPPVRLNQPSGGGESLAVDAHEEDPKHSANHADGPQMMGPAIRTLHRDEDEDEGPGAAAGRGRTTFADSPGPSDDEQVDSSRMQESESFALLPPGGAERFRFVAPAVLSFDGYEETFEVALNNVSLSGLSCSGPQGLGKHDRVRLKFRLDPVSLAQSFLCEVRWASKGVGETAHYGLAFVALQPAAEEALQDAVQRLRGDRSMHDAALAQDSGNDAFADPELTAFRTDMPGQSSPLRHAVGSDRRASLSWRATSMAALAGLLAGAGLTLLLLGLLPQRPAVMPLAALHTPSPALVPPDGKAVELAPDDAGGDPAVAVAAGPTSPSQMVEPKAAAPTTGSTAPAVRSLDAVPTKPAQQVHVSVRQLGNLRLEEGPKQTDLLLLLDASSSRHDTFWLHNPNRLVVDVPGRRSRLSGKNFEVDGRLVQRVRVGQHPGKVRFVVETRGRAAPKVVATQQGSTLRLTLAQ